MKRMGGACGGDIKQFIGPIYHSGPQIRPPFATLPLVQNAGRGVGGGGVYMRDVTISLAITPFLVPRN